MDAAHATASMGDAADVSAPSQGTGAASAPGVEPVPEGLTRREVDVLRFERQWWVYAGNKEQAIRDMFDLSPTRYYQVLNKVIDDPVALEVDPLLVRRLRRLRSNRQKTRAARRLGIEL